MEEKWYIWNVALVTEGSSPEDCVWDYLQLVGHTAGDVLDRIPVALRGKIRSIA